MWERRSYTLEHLTNLTSDKVKFKWKYVKQKMCRKVKQIVSRNNLSDYTDLKKQFEIHNNVLSEAMPQKLEGVHVGFLNQITGQRAVQQKYETLRYVSADKAIKKALTQSLGEYIDRQKVTVAEWLELRPILVV